MLTRARHILVLVALAIWLGGLTFYAGVVVPIGTGVLGSIEQGFLTQQVTRWWNLISVGVFVILSWDIFCERSRLRLSAFALMLACQIGLFLLHPQLDALLDASTFSISDSDAFYRWHRWYLLTTTLLWAAGMTYLVSLAWRAPATSNERA